VVDVISPCPPSRQNPAPSPTGNSTCCAGWPKRLRTRDRRRLHLSSGTIRKLLIQGNHKTQARTMADAVRIARDSSGSNLPDRLEHPANLCHRWRMSHPRSAVHRTISCRRGELAITVGQPDRLVVRDGLYRPLRKRSRHGLPWLDCFRETAATECSSSSTGYRQVALIESAAP